MDLTLLPEDLSPEEKASLQEYVENGCPGLTKINDTKVFSWFELYMSGKSYNEIASITKDRRDLILYVSHKAKWHVRRMEYYNDISNSLTGKLQKVRIESANTVVTAITALGKYYNEKFNRFLLTNDSNIIEGMDTKTLAQYYKSLEMLEKLVNPSKNTEDPGKNPGVTINVGSNATVKQTDDNTLDIQTDDAAGDLLKALSKFQRSKEK